MESGQDEQVMKRREDSFHTRIVTVRDRIEQLNKELQDRVRDALYSGPELAPMSEPERAVPATALHSVVSEVDEWLDKLQATIRNIQL